MKPNDFIEIINELNADLYDRVKYVQEGFSYTTDGYCDQISFNGMHLWSSEMDDREYDEDKYEYEPLLPFLKREFNKVIDDLYSLKFN